MWRVQFYIYIYIFRVWRSVNNNTDTGQSTHLYQDKQQRSRHQQLLVVSHRDCTVYKQHLCTQKQAVCRRWEHLGQRKVFWRTDDRGLPNSRRTKRHYRPQKDQRSATSNQNRRKDSHVVNMEFKKSKRHFCVHTKQYMGILPSVLVACGRSWRWSICRFKASTTAI